VFLRVSPTGIAVGSVVGVVVPDDDAAGNTVLAIFRSPLVFHPKQLFARSKYTFSHHLEKQLGFSN
jgi:hypothetical protein